VSVLERSLHFGPRTCVTTPLRSNCLGFGLSCFCILKYASSRGRGNVVIPKGFPRSVGRVESRLLGFPCFPYSVISMACFGNAYYKIKVPAKARFSAKRNVHLCRDSESETRNPLDTGRTDGSYHRPEGTLDSPYCTHDLCPTDVCPSCPFVSGSTVDRSFSHSVITPFGAWLFALSSLWRC
jgi:hypothetical protein